MNSSPAPAPPTPWPFSLEESTQDTWLWGPSEGGAGEGQPIHVASCLPGFPLSWFSKEGSWGLRGGVTLSGEKKGDPYWVPAPASWGQPRVLAQPHEGHRLKDSPEKAQPGGHCLAPGPLATLQRQKTSHRVSFLETWTWPAL